MCRVRLFVLWMMMFAVPLQGYAAAAMTFCAPGGAAAMAAASEASYAVHDHARHRHADGPADPQHDHAAAPAHDGTGAHGGAESDAMHKCGSCAACHAVALTGTPELAAFHHLPRADLAEPGRAMTTRAPRVLEKPPRAV